MHVCVALDLQFDWGEYYVGMAKCVRELGVVMVTERKQRNKNNDYDS